jgi:ribosome-associated protein
MDIRKLQRAIVDGLEDVKAQQIAVFNTEHLSAMFERVIIASGTSNRQTKALAASVRDAVKSSGMQVMSTEGEDNGEWIIVDCGAAVAHIMQPAIRDYYHLEEIWGGKSVRMKVGEVNNKLVKASEPEPAPRKRAARSASNGTGRASGPEAEKSPRPAVKRAAKKAASPPKNGAGNTAPKAAKKTSAPRKIATRKASPAAGKSAGAAGKRNAPGKAAVRG